MASASTWPPSSPGMQTDPSNVDNPPIFSDMASDPILLNVRLDRGTLGCRWRLPDWARNFPGIITLQWNDMFRDDVRRFVRGDAGMVAHPDVPSVRQR